jgi:hypothetical protein
MAKNSVTDYDTTAANNAEVGGIAIEGSDNVANFDNALREIMSHIADGTTMKTHVGLANVDNTPDADKPVSTAQQTALNAKFNSAGGTISGGARIAGGSLTGDFSLAFDADGAKAQSFANLPIILNPLGNPVLIGTTSKGSATNGDLVVDGGVFLGGTAAANKLDDYEVGSFTPTDASGAGLVFSFSEGHYVVIGDYVFVNFRVQYPSTSDTNSASIGGLPFSQSGTNSGYPGGIAHYQSTGSNTYTFRRSTSTSSFIAELGSVQTNAQVSGTNLQVNYSYIRA